MSRALSFTLCCLLFVAAPAISQVADNAPSIGVQAVHALTPHLILIPNTPVPKTGQPLPTNGHWSMANQPPAQCANLPAGSGPCVKLIYSVPDAGVSCEWVVVLNADATDVTFLDENDDAAHYFMPKLYATALKPLVLRKSLPVYPPIAGAAHVEGDVKVKIPVAADGKSSKPVVISGPPMLVQTSLDTAESYWKFKPLQIGQRTVPYEAEILFRFSYAGFSASIGSVP